MPPAGAVLPPAIHGAHAVHDPQHHHLFKSLSEDTSVILGASVCQLLDSHREKAIPATDAPGRWQLRLRHEHEAKGLQDSRKLVRSVVSPVTTLHTRISRWNRVTGGLLSMVRHLRVERVHVSRCSQQGTVLNLLPAARRHQLLVGRRDVRVPAVVCRDRQDTLRPQQRRHRLRTGCRKCQGAHLMDIC